MPCTCTKGLPFRDLLPTVEVIAAILMANRRISGVALSGSIARGESHCHDIDLVILHGGELEDGNCQNPPRVSVSDVLLESMVGRRAAQVLRHVYATRFIPVSYFFMHEKVLWECRYLQTFAKQERFPGFYRTIVSQIPLYLLWIGEEAKHLLQFVHGVEPTVLYESDGAKYTGIQVRHLCYQERCKPVAPWLEIHRQILARKEHRQSEFASQSVQGLIVDPRDFDS